MLISIPLLLAAFPPVSAAGAPLALDPDAGHGEPLLVLRDLHGRGYWAAAGAEKPEEPGPGAEGDCAGEDGPRDPVASLTWNLEHLRDGHFPTTGLPHYNPRCLVLHAALDPEAAAVTASRCGAERVRPCDLVSLAQPTSTGSAEARVTYNLTSGEYTAALRGPHNETYGGSLGIRLWFDCRDCDPPW